MPSRKQNKTGQIERWALAGLIVGGISIAICYPMYYRGTLAVHPAVLGVPLSALAVFLASAWDRKRGHA